MLSIIFGRENCADFVLDTRIWFKRNKKSEWFQNKFVQRVLQEIDKATVMFDEVLKDYRGRGITTEQISTGSKTLCSIYFDDKNTIFYGTAMGDNCIPFLMEIAEIKDITIVLEHYMDFSEHYFLEHKVRMGDKFLNQIEYDCAYSDWCEDTTRIAELWDIYPDKSTQEIAEIVHQERASGRDMGVW